MIVKPFDRERLRREFTSAQPFPFMAVEDFLEEDFAHEVAASYPTFESVERMGFQFNFVNEQRKVQVSDPAKFPEPVRKLNDFLASPGFLDDLSYITGIPKLLADPQLAGGGMHVTGPGGRLDVHVDFNYHEAVQLHRRLNILIYMNERWDADWGGQLELWDRDVQHRHHAFVPKLNRCVVFETSEISYHGVTPLRCPPETARCSFAAYYYTKEAPAGWTGAKHSTLFKARPDEKVRGMLLMPAERLQRAVKERLGQARSRLKGWIRQ